MSPEEFRDCAIDTLHGWLPGYTDPLTDGEQRKIVYEGDGVFAVYNGTIYADLQAKFKVDVVVTPA